VHYQLELKDLDLFLDYLFSLESPLDAIFDYEEDSRTLDIIAVNFGLSK